MESQLSLVAAFVLNEDVRHPEGLEADFSEAKVSSLGLKHLVDVLDLFYFI